MAKQAASNKAVATDKFSLDHDWLEARLDAGDIEQRPVKASKTREIRAINSLEEVTPGLPQGLTYSEFPVGRFEGEPHLVWIGPDRFRHEPRTENAFCFIRHNGECIQPGKMETDGGSIPRPLWPFKDLSPWGYAPAFLIHDWLFDQHHSGSTTLSFEEVRDILMEGIRTLMESGVCRRDRVAFDLIHAGVDSFVARAIWNK